ncbi:MAG: MarR family transcriptional regulator [Hyphomicrobiaceae bacterium]|nr:MarR family transcriptional regulator [Hyphomicrobiaceae bacterium]
MQRAGDETTKRLAPANEKEREQRDRLIACVELLFFAYRDFTNDPDQVLEQYGFGRAHHRVLHFVHRNPGLRVADLLHILKITKQSLARVLKQLIDEGFVTQRSGKADRRERLLFATAKGSRLADKLADLQMRRIELALDKAGPGADAMARRFLFAMIGEQDRERVEALIGIHEPAHDKTEFETREST